MEVLKFFRGQNKDQSGLHKFVGNCITYFKKVDTVSAIFFLKDGDYFNIYFNLLRNIVYHCRRTYVKCTLPVNLISTNVVSSKFNPCYLGRHGKELDNFLFHIQKLISLHIVSFVTHRYRLGSMVALTVFHLFQTNTNFWNSMIFSEQGNQ